MVSRRLIISELHELILNIAQVPEILDASINRKKKVVK